MISGFTSTSAVNSRVSLSSNFVTSISGWPYCVGFAAESENLVEFGAVKREKKGIPLLVGNIGPQTFGQDDNTVILFDEDGHTVLPRADKLTLARQLISEIAKRIEQRSLLT